MTTLDAITAFPTAPAKTKAATKTTTTKPKTPAKAKAAPKATTKPKAKTTTKAAPKAKAKATTKAKTPTAILPRIARELKIDPKKARAKLRKAHGSGWRNLTEAGLRKELTAA